MSYKIAGIDVHKKVLMVVVIDASMPESKPERRRFATMPSALRRLLTWLREQGVEEAVMESTAQYWRSVWLELEPYMRLQLAQAFSNRAPRGRKHDFKDAERLVRRLIANELILSFVPDGEQRSWRNLTRMKLQLTRDRVRLQSQMECLLEEMRIKLSIVVSDLLGASGLRILHALAEGETNPKQLALLGDDRAFLASLFGSLQLRTFFNLLVWSTLFSEMIPLSSCLIAPPDTPLKTARINFTLPLLLFVDLVVYSPQWTTFFCGIRTSITTNWARVRLLC